jgi:hypothetical protein
LGGLLEGDGYTLRYPLAPIGRQEPSDDIGLSLV